MSGSIRAMPSCDHEASSFLEGFLEEDENKFGLIQPSLRHEEFLMMELPVADPDRPDDGLNDDESGWGLMDGDDDDDDDDDGIASESEKEGERAGEVAAPRTPPPNPRRVVVVGLRHVRDGGHYFEGDDIRQITPEPQSPPKVSFVSSANSCVTLAEIQSQYQRTLRKLASSMRRSEETRSIVKRQRCTEPNFFTSPKAYTMEQNRNCLYRMISLSCGNAAGALYY
jgi:hypothetical protein